MTPSEILELVKELVGPIEPVGETEMDHVRLGNLRKMIAVTNMLLFQIDAVVHYKENYQASMKKAGSTADQFMKEIKENY